MRARDSDFDGYIERDGVKVFCEMDSALPRCDIRPVDYRDVGADGATRAASLIGGLL